MINFWQTTDVDGKQVQSTENVGKQTTTTIQKLWEIRASLTEYSKV